MSDARDYEDAYLREEEPHATDTLRILRRQIIELQTRNAKLTMAIRKLRDAKGSLGKTNAYEKLIETLGECEG